MQPDARHEDGGNGNERQIQVAGWKFKRQHCALILAEEVLDSFERDWIDVPGVSRNVSDPADSAVTGRVKPVIHACPEPKGHKLTAPMPVDDPFIT